jgi:DNA-binding NtrC family response regulator
VPPSTDTTTAEGRDECVQPVGVRCLSVIHGGHGAERGARVMVDSEPVVIGRLEHVPGPLALSDTRVSKRHATVRRDAATGVVVLEDAGSRNGTFVDGVRVQRAELRGGEVVRVGATLLLYEQAEVRHGEALDPPRGVLEGPSLALQRVRGEIRRFAPHSIPALILGESGVGKELVALEIHRQSRRSGRLVTVNCAAISANLAESEIFGHAAHSFTGAQHKHEGLFSAAAGGTLFLDEIGEMHLDLQAKVLRAIAVGEIRPVGSSQPERVDVRVVAATHRNLDQAAEKGTFRGDLLARLRGWELRVPPLRERRADILPLAARFFQEGSATALGRDEPRFTADVAEALLLHAWPYNVRELQQVMTVAAVRGGGESLRIHHLPEAIAAPLVARIRSEAPSTPPVASSAPPPLELVVPRDRPPTREELEQVLVRTGGNMADAATFFGKDRRQIYRWAVRLGLDPESFRRA